jgi:nucleoside-diphosphate-sugar epimerase
MSYNRLAIYGHRGWASSAIAQALLTSGAPAKLLYRPGSNANGLKGNFDEIEVDIQDQDALRAALKDVDILMYPPPLPAIFH